MQRLYSTFARGWPGIGLLCPPRDCGNYRFPFQRKRFGFKLVLVDDDDRGRCCLAPLRRSVDADCGQHDGWCRSLDRIFSNRRSLGPNAAGRSGRCARYARAWCLVDRCPPVRKKTSDSLIEEAASHARLQGNAYSRAIESGGYVYGNNNRLRTERTLSRNCPCSIGRKDDRTRT